MSMFKSNPLSASSPQTGITAGEWLESRKKDSLNEGLNKASKKYAFLDDSSSDESFSASNFLKKSAVGEQEESQDIKKKDFADQVRPKSSHGAPERKAPPVTYPTRGGGSALARFSNLEKQILSRQNIPTLMSSSDMDLDISSDSEIKRQVFKIKNSHRYNHAAADEPSYDAAKGSKHTSSADDSKSDSKRKDVKKKTVSFASNLVAKQPSESSASLDEFLPDQYSADEVSLNDVLPASNLYGVMSLDDLQPAVDVEEADHKRDLLNLHSIDELLPASTDEQINKELSSRSESVSSSIGSASNLFNVQSIDDLVPETSLPPEQKTDEALQEKHKSSTTTVQKQKEVDEYSEDFQSDSDDTLKDTESITQDITEEIKTETTESIATETILTESQSKVSDLDSYTESFDSITSSTRSSTPQSILQRKSSPRNDVAIQTDIIGVSAVPYADKKFTTSEKTFYQPSQVINNEALAVLSSHSPAVLAVQEMLKQQLQFTRDFVARSERLHKAAAETLIADYQYASIEEARQAINDQRRKARLPPRYPTS